MQRRKKILFEFFFGLCKQIDNYITLCWLKGWASLSHELSSIYSKVCRVLGWIVQNECRTKEKRNTGILHGFKMWNTNQTGNVVAMLSDRAQKKYICKATLHFNIVLWECVQTVFGEIQLVSTNQMKYANQHDGQLNVPHIIRTYVVVANVFTRWRVSSMFFFH